MAQHDFLGAVLPEAGAGFSAAAVPAQVELLQRAGAVDEVAERLDLIHLEDGERDEVGGESTVDERELNVACGDLVKAAPEVVTGRGWPETLFGDALALEEALVRLKEASAMLLAASRAGMLLLGAELTEHNDRVEEVVAEGRGATGEAERNEWDALFANVTQIRKGDRDLQLQRGARKARRKARQELLLRAAKEQPQRLAQIEALRQAPLSLAAPRRARRAGKGKGKQK